MKHQVYAETLLKAWDTFSPSFQARVSHLCDS